MRGRGRALVVDADVARGAADPERASRGQVPDRRALAFRRCMGAIGDAGHTLVFGPRLWGEWRTHASHATRTWLTRMASRNLVVRLDDEPDDAWLVEAIHAGLPAHDRGVAKKDAHLVATAELEADKRILSGDDRAREKYVRLVAVEPRLAPLHWVNPSSSGVRDWLLSRAPDRGGWTLGGPDPGNA